MRLSNFLVTFSACALFAACANDEMPGGNNLPQGNGEQAFIAVRLAAPNAMTRAFQDGDEAENAVTKARFYFFDPSDEAAIVANNVNYIDVKEDFEFTDPNVDNIEKRSVILALNGSTVTPAKMVVVLNPPTSLTGSIKLSELITKTGNYLKDSDTDLTQEGNFVMSNSVYMNSSNQIINAVDISGNIAATAEAAQASPVEIYVERVLAKVEVKSSNTDVSTTTTSFDTGEDFDTDGSGNTSAQDVKAKIIGWDIVNCSKNSYLVKNITTDWNSTAPFSGWNAANLFRCYWAQSPTTDNDAKNTLSYSDVTLPTNARYCQERTTIASGSQPATLLVTAQLQVGNDVSTGTTIAEYAGRYWTLADLKKQIAGQINGTSASSPIYYKKTADESWTAINAEGSPEQLINFRARTSEETSEFKAYQSIATLADTYLNGYEFAKDKDGKSKYTNTAEVNAVLENYVALIWNEGKTYYYVPIEHVAANGGTSAINGVVRNHWYQINITAIKGLGTPIPPYDNDDEEEPINPEVPDDNNSYLAAQINILNWGIVSQDVTLGEKGE